MKLIYLITSEDLWRLPTSFRLFVLNIIYFNLIVICPLLISLLNYLFLFYFVCVWFLLYYLLFDLIEFWFRDIGIYLSKTPSKISWFLFSFTFFCGFWMNMENIWFLCYTYNYKICFVELYAFNLILFFFLKQIMHMVMILMLTFCMRRDFGYFVILKISVILKEKIAFIFPSVFSCFVSYLFSICGFIFCFGLF